MPTRVSLVLLFCFLFGSVQAEDPVHFPDANLKAIVEEALWISDPTPSDMLSLTSLIHPEAHTQYNAVTDLTGLEYASNLQTLNLRLHCVRDLSPLSGLHNLRKIDLSKNKVTSVSPLSELTQLEDLDLHWNDDIDDLSPLSGLGHLRRLILRRCAVGDISVLSTLTSLQEIDLTECNIRDVSPLSGLSGLRQINLYENGISDISSLTGLANLRSLSLGDNPLDERAYENDLRTIAENNPNAYVFYDPNPRPPASVSASDGIHRDRVAVNWSTVPNGPRYTSYYRVYRASSDHDTPTPISMWQTTTSYDDVTAEPGTTYYYSVRAATSDQGSGAGQYSDSVAGRRGQECSLTLSSTAGGSVTSPAEGAHTCEPQTIVSVTVEPVDPNLYAFSHWEGTAVDAGKVSRHEGPPATITVDGNYTLKACFVSLMDILRVDDDAVEDVEPNDLTISDPHEDGTQMHPFDSIQEAIEVAAPGSTVVVRPGTYYEIIDFLGKSIQLTGIDPNDPNVMSFPVIDAAGQGSAVTFARGEDPNCSLTGFVITRGHGHPAGAIYCEASSPAIANCLIVGNRAADPNGAAVYCTESSPTLLNCTIADNCAGRTGAGLWIEDGSVAVVDSILWNNGPLEILSAGNSDISISYSSVAGGWFDTGNIDVDPLFAQQGRWATPEDPNRAVGPEDAEAIWIDGDYHLQSPIGRWDARNRTWLQDDRTSCCIDLGDPNSPVENEPAPNGAIINMGAFGGTRQASLSEEEIGIH